MKVRFRFFAQVRQAAGAETAQVDLPEDSDLAVALAAAADGHGEAFRQLVLDDSGAARPSLLALVNGVPAPRTGRMQLHESDEVTLLSAVSGG